MRAVTLLIALSQWSATVRRASGLEADESVEALLLGGANDTDIDTADAEPVPHWPACRACWLEHDSLVTVAYKVDVIGYAGPSSDLCHSASPRATVRRRTLARHCPSCGGGSGGNESAAFDAHSRAYCVEVLYLRGMHSVIVGIVQKAVTLLGFVTNVVSLKVLMRSELRRRPFNHLLQIVNVNDIVLMTLIFLLDVFHLLSHTVASAANHYEFARLVDPLVMMSFMFSIYMTLLTTLNRWAAVCRPFRAIEWISIGHVNASAAAILLAAVAFNAVRFFDLRIAEDDGHYYSQKWLADWSSHPAYMWSYKVVAYVAVYGALPLCGLLALGADIARRLVVARWRQRAVAPADRGDGGGIAGRRDMAAERQLALLQLAIAVTFVVCGAPKIAYVAVKVVYGADKLDPYNDSIRGLRNIWSAVSSIMLIANGLLNDVLCYAMMRHYREIVNEMFRSCFRSLCRTRS